MGEEGREKELFHNFNWGHLYINNWGHSTKRKAPSKPLVFSIILGGQQLLAVNSGSGRIMYPVCKLTYVIGHRL